MKCIKQLDINNMAAHNKTEVETTVKSYLTTHWKFCLTHEYIASSTPSSRTLGEFEIMPTQAKSDSPPTCYAESHFFQASASNVYRNVHDIISAFCYTKI